MSVTVSYTKENRLVIKGLKCDCPLRHTMPTQDIYVGTDLIKKLPAYIKKRELGTKCVLVADRTTYELAGRACEERLINSGFAVSACILDRGDKPVEPDEFSLGEVLMTMRMDTEFFISVGSGTVTDTTRTVAAQTERPFVCVGTAPSMDGYTSVVAPLIHHGVKVHLPAICPEIIVCDLDIMRTAPSELFAAGVGDVLGKYIAKADWVLGNIINDEPYCHACGGIVIEYVSRLLDNLEEIKNRTEKGARVLIEALIMAGITIMIVGNTRAVASVEHNISHYWEMRQLAAGLPNPRHGLAVGVATLLVWPYFENFAKIDPASIEVDRALRLHISRAAREKFLLDSYGEAGAKNIMEENPGDFLTDEELSRRVRRAKERFGDIAREISLLPSRETIRSGMEVLGCPLRPAEIGISDAVALDALNCCKDYRSRYTLFKLLDEIGYATDTPQLHFREKCGAGDENV